MRLTSLRVWALAVPLLVGCSSGPRISLNTAALFPTLAPRSRCRTRPGPVEPVVGRVVVLTLEGHRTVRRIAGIPGDEIAVRGGVLYRNGTSTEREEKHPRVMCLSGVSPRCACRIHVEQIGDRRVPIQSILPVAGLHDARCFPTPDAPPFEVPEGTVYVLADNRDAAPDSRALGPIPRDRLEARLLACGR